jgi:3-oxoacyl-[acyl-carrier protein] reductase
MDLGLKGKVVLISGGYRGTGAGTAQVLAAEGAKVAVHGFHVAQADEVVAKITAVNLDAASVDGDLGTNAGVERIVGQTTEAFGPIDILVNNYGAPSQTNWDTSPDTWLEGWDKNVLSGIRLTQAVIPSMREKKWGRIIFVGTIGTEKPSNKNPDYYSAKGALPTLVRSLAKELQGSGVTANLVSPGMIATEEVREMVLRRATREGIDTWQEAEQWAVTNMMPNLTRRMPTPEDIGRFIAFVASEAAWHLTAADLKVDGGAVDA